MGIATGKKVAALLNIGVAAIIFSQQVSVLEETNRWLVIKDVGLSFN